MQTILLLRHADIDPPPGNAPDDWPLNALGRARAEELVHVAGSAGVTALYVSEALRTQQTVAPLAASRHIVPRLTPDLSQLVHEVVANNGAVLIAGHSNTVPKMIVAFGAPFADDLVDGHDNLFVVTVADAGAANVVRLKYGAPTP
jgi:broad specificity phosphatase PhoE